MELFGRQEWYGIAWPIEIVWNCLNSAKRFRSG